MRASSKWEIVKWTGTNASQTHATTDDRIMDDGSFTAIAIVIRINAMRRSCSRPRALELP